MAAISLSINLCIYIYMVYYLHPNTVWCSAYDSEIGVSDGPDIKS